jgi:P27 family predicted phage terminase small subunit
VAGRRPKPIELHQLGGNPSKLSNEELSGADNPNPKKGEPEMPKGMSKAARREWRHIVPELMEVGVLSIVDGKALAGYCESYALWEQARTEYQKHGITFREMFEVKGVMIAGDIKQNPAVTIANQALKTMKAFLIEFGLTPASRRNLKIEKKSGDENPMDNFMNRKKAVGERPRPFAAPQPIAPPKEMEP